MANFRFCLLAALMTLFFIMVGNIASATAETTEEEGETNSTATATEDVVAEAEPEKPVAVPEIELEEI